MKYLYKIIHYVDGEGKSIFRVKRRLFPFYWKYLKRARTHGEFRIRYVKEYDTEENALACAEFDAGECRKDERNKVSATKVQY